MAGWDQGNRRDEKRPLPVWQEPDKCSVSGAGLGSTYTGDDLSCTHKSKTITAKVIAAKSCKREAVHESTSDEIGSQSDCENYNTHKNDVQGIF